jgi:class 3 adenylate cyclase
MERPETRYARSGEANIAYQLFGEGEVELLVLGGPAMHVELVWDEPLWARYYERLASFARVVIFDRRGTGASDAVEGPATLEQQADDMIAVIDAAGFDRPAVAAGSDAARAAVLFAATYPDRLSALVLNGASAAGAAVLQPELLESVRGIVESSWGKGELAYLYAPSLADDPRFRQFIGRLERLAASPGMARKLLEMNLKTDVRAILPSVRTRTLVLHRRDDRLVPLELGREVAAGIPNARFVELEGIDNTAFVGDADALLDEIEEFLTGARLAREPDRVLATVLFTDLVGSTARVAAEGDERWRRTLREHNRVVRQELERFRGREVKTVGDGFLATFDGPARAVRAAAAIRSALSAAGLEVRAGVHTGEVEVEDSGDVSGIAVHIGARVAAAADPGDILVSQTVHDLVVGSGLTFADRGVRQLKGVPGEWRLFAVSS